MCKSRVGCSCLHRIFFVPLDNSHGASNKGKKELPMAKNFVDQGLIHSGGLEELRKRVTELFMNSFAPMTRNAHNILKK
ncbi:hypothetical protein E2C01_053612 [Portunus trituberculatus]|uniref:Uncharacterized protein n=1 Tax=Portunus trituberculatus TaxID=210409 RepID=A0A5B7GQS6_PORTR|nr:hypothetical protein [Portunus trituberculatus]